MKQTKEKSTKIVNIIKVIQAILIVLIFFILPPFIYNNYSNTYKFPELFASYCELIQHPKTWIITFILYLMLLCFSYNYNMDLKKNLDRENNFELEDFTKNIDKFIQRLIAICGGRIISKNIICNSDKYARYLKMKNIEIISIKGESIDYFYSKNNKINVFYINRISTKNSAAEILARQEFVFQSWNDNILCFTKDDLHIRIYFEFFCEGIEVCRGDMPSKIADISKENIIIPRDFTNALIKLKQSLKK